MKTDEFVTLADTSSREFKAAMDIYLKAFPENERQPLEKIEYRVRHKRNSLIVVKRDKVVVGFSLFYLFRDMDFALGDYMAVRQDYRNLGIGSKLFQKTYELFEMDTPGGFLLGEVEDPAYGNIAERSIRLRRVQLYERLGASVILNFKYLLPPISGQYPTKMLLMVYAGNRRVNITADVLRTLLIAVYKEVYERDIGDPYLKKMLLSLTDDSKIQVSERGKWK